MSCRVSSSILLALWCRAPSIRPQLPPRRARARRYTRTNYAQDAPRRSYKTSRNSGGASKHEMCSDVGRVFYFVLLKKTETVGRHLVLAK